MLFAVCACLTKEGRRVLVLEKGIISRSGNMRRKNNNRFDNIKWARCGCESQSSYMAADGYEKCRS